VAHPTKKNEKKKKLRPDLQVDPKADQPKDATKSKNLKRKTPNETHKERLQFPLMHQEADGLHDRGRTAGREETKGHFSNNL